MKKTHFGMIVMSGLLVANVALAQDNTQKKEGSQAPAPAPSAAPMVSAGSMPTAPSTVDSSQAWTAASVEPTKVYPSDVRTSDSNRKVTYDAFISPAVQIGSPNAISLRTGGQAQVVLNMPDFKDADSGYLSGKRIVLTTRATVDANGHSADGSSGHVVNGGSLQLEASGFGDYSKDGPEYSKAWVARGLWERNPGTGQTGASTLAIGHEWSQGNDSAPTGTRTSMPIQKGFSIRKDLLVEAGKGRVDGIQHGSSLMVNGVAEAAIQHCFNIEGEMEKAICLTGTGGGKLGTQAEINLGGRAIFASKLDSKNYLYAGIEANTAVGTSLWEAGGQNNALTTGLVIGVAAK